MILFTKAFVANGKTFATLEEAQGAAIEALFPVGKEDPGWRPNEIAKQIIEQSEALLNILTTTESSRPMARKANGGRKPRKPKTETPTQPELETQ